MHEADDAYSIWSTWSCYWLDQFLTLALDAWILSKFSTLYWICLLLVFLILVGVELLYVYSDHSILECFYLFSGVELSMRSFFVIIIGTHQYLLSLGSCIKHNTLYKLKEHYMCKSDNINRPISSWIILTLKPGELQLMLQRADNINALRL